MHVHERIIPLQQALVSSHELPKMLKKFMQRRRPAPAGHAGHALP